MPASFFGSSVPTRCFSTYGPAKAFCTGTCWSIANPTSSANGSSASSLHACGSSVNQSASAIVTEDIPHRATLGMLRVRAREVAPARVLGLELAERVAARLDVPVLCGVVEREELRVRRRQHALRHRLLPVAGAVGEREVEQPAQLADGPVLGAQVDHALPRLALGSDDDD